MKVVKQINTWIDKYEKIIMLGLCIALAIVLGLAIQQYQTNKSIDRKLNTQAARIISLGLETKAAKRGAILACKAGKPSLTRLIMDLANDFQRRANNDFSILKITQVESPLYNARVKALNNDQDLVSILHDYLPIECVKRVQKQINAKSSRK